MFHFPCLPPPSLCVELGVPRFYLSGLPHSGILGLLARQLTEAFRSLATPFIGP